VSNGYLAYGFLILSFPAAKRKSPALRQGSFRFNGVFPYFLGGLFLLAGGFCLLAGAAGLAAGAGISGKAAPVKGASFLDCAIAHATTAKRTTAMTITGH
jgi:hypothetical protein